MSAFLATLLGFHVTQFFLFISRLVPALTPAVGRWAWWLSSEASEVVNDGHKVLNFDCLVSCLLQRSHLVSGSSDPDF